ncbi:hypothetical protein ES708_15514 [subsurface metagenome]
MNNKNTIPPKTVVFIPILIFLFVKGLKIKRILLRIIFNRAITTNPFVIPIRGININPAAIDPNTLPMLLIE